jgi:hypothetical protein
VRDPRVNTTCPTQSQDAEEQDSRQTSGKNHVSNGCDCISGEVQSPAIPSPSPECQKYSRKGKHGSSARRQKPKRKSECAYVWRDMGRAPAIPSPSPECHKYSRTTNSHVPHNLRARWGRTIRKVNTIKGRRDSRHIADFGKYSERVGQGIDVLATQINGSPCGGSTFSKAFEVRSYNHTTIFKSQGQAIQCKTSRERESQRGRTVCAATPHATNLGVECRRGPIGRQQRIIATDLGRPEGVGGSRKKQIPARQLWDSQRTFEIA